MDKLPSLSWLKFHIVHQGSYRDRAEWQSVSRFYLSILPCLYARDTKFVPLEVNNPKLAFGSTTSVAHGYHPSAIPSCFLFQWRK
jgi:hypothetical protein